MSSMTFIVNDAATGTTNPKVQVTITENGDGTLKFDVVQLDTAGAYLGDLRGFFFDVANEALIGKLQVRSPSAPVSNLLQGNDSVTDVGGGANMNGLTNATDSKTSKTAGAEANGYDVGFQIGSEGVGEDDVRELHFTLATSHGCGLTLDDFVNVDFGVRLHLRRSGPRRQRHDRHGAQRQGEDCRARLQWRLRSSQGGQRLGGIHQRGFHGRRQRA